MSKEFKHEPTATLTEAAVVADGGALPALVKVVAGYDGTNVQVLKTDAAGELQVDVLSSALPAGAATLAEQQAQTALLGSIDGNIIKADTDNVTVVASALPAGASTAAKQDTGNTSLASIDSKIVAVDTGNVTVAASALPTGAATEATLSALNAKVIKADTDDVTVTASALPTGAATEATLAALNAKVVKADTDDVTVTSSALPTGAATLAEQQTQSTSLASIDAGIPAALGQTTMTASMPVVLASNQPALPPSRAVTGSGSAAAATVTTVATLTAPANAIGFILMNIDTSTTNMRWAVGRAAAVNLGQQLQPGRDTGFVPIGANVSIIAESGTVTYDIQWIAQ